MKHFEYGFVKDPESEVIYNFIYMCVCVRVAQVMRKEKSSIIEQIRLTCKKTKT